MICVMLFLGHCFFEHLIAAQAPPSPCPQHRTPLEVRKPAFLHGIAGYCANLAIWKKQCTGTFVTTFKPELRTSSDILQWTDRYWQVAGYWFPPDCTIHHPLGPHRWCQRKSTRCHLLESFDIVHVLTEAFLGFLFKCPDSPISTIYYTEFHHASLPTPVHLHLSIFSTVVRLQNWPAHSLK